MGKVVLYLILTSTKLLTSILLLTINRELNASNTTQSMILQ